MPFNTLQTPVNNQYTILHIQRHIASKITTTDDDPMMFPAIRESKPSAFTIFESCMVSSMAMEPLHHCAMTCKHNATRGIGTNSSLFSSECTIERMKHPRIQEMMLRKMIVR